MANDNGPTWSVVAQTEDFGPSGSGQYVPGVRVSFRTAGGSTGSVFIPQDQYTVAEVKRRVSEQAAAMNTVDQLQG